MEKCKLDWVMEKSNSSTQGEVCWPEWVTHDENNFFGERV